MSDEVQVYRCGQTLSITTGNFPENGCINVTKLDGDAYFNRLFVTPRARNHGLAKKMMSRLIEELDDLKWNLVCEINPYGDLNYEQLEKFYFSYGFEKRDGHLIRICKRGK